MATSVLCVGLNDPRVGVKPNARMLPTQIRLTRANCKSFSLLNVLECGLIEGGLGTRPMLFGTEFVQQFRHTIRAISQIFKTGCRLETQASFGGSVIKEW